MPVPPQQRRLAARAPATVLVVEDEVALLELVTRTLGLSGFHVLPAATVAEAVVQASTGSPSVAVIDVMLPDGSGLELIPRLQQLHPDLAVVVLTARDSVEDRLTGFALGADDYVSKPFAVAELVARVNAVVRRSAPVGRVGPEVLELADLRMDDEAHLVTRHGRLLDLSPTEYRLLRYLLANAGRVLSRSELLANVWDYPDDVGGAVVEKFISQVRRKVDLDGCVPLVHTVRGFGYVLRVTGAEM